MSTQNKFWCYTVQAQVDLSDLTAGTGKVFKAATHSGDIAANADTAIGIIQFAAESQGHVSIGYAGIQKYTAGGAITKGNALAVTTSGYITAAGSLDRTVGEAMEDVTSGSVGKGVFNFVNKPAAVDSLWLNAYGDQYAFSAQADLSAAASVGLAVDFSGGDFAASGNTASGVLISGTTSGGSSIAKTQGKVLARAGGVITQDASLTVAASGWFTAGNSGDMLVGRALQASAAGNSGSTFYANLNMATPHYATSCLDVQY